MNASWRLDQLADVVARALETAAYDGQASGRVREVPDKRTIRYYTTLGLLDRPAEYRGRVAYYGRRHVLQLVASPISDAEFRDHALIRLLLAHGSRALEDSLA